jgi:hypothetical protein
VGVKKLDAEKGRRVEERKVVEYNECTYIA